MIQLQVTVERTICKVRGVERQPATQVLVNPPAGLEEIFTLQTEGKKVRFSFFWGGGGDAALAAEQGSARASMHPLQAGEETTGANLSDKKYIYIFNNLIQEYKSQFCLFFKLVIPYLHIT